MSIMRLKVYQWGELIGIFFLLASTATQIFYVEPLKREIEWRLSAFNMQQNGQLQMKAIYDARIATLQAMNAPGTEIQKAQTELAAVISKYQTADANVADYLLAKEPIETYLQVIVIALFAVGSLMAGIGRVLEMVSGRRLE